MKTNIERIAYFIDNQNIKVSHFEQNIGISNGAIRKAIKNHTDIQSKWFSIILDKYPISPEWLITGKGEMLRNIEVGEIVSTRASKAKEKKLDQQLVPFYGIPVTAGIVGLFADHQEVPLSYISIPNMPAADGAVTISGDSMYPLLKAGDMVIYKIMNLNDVILWGEMYIVVINTHESTISAVKFVQQSDKGEDHIKLVSQNQYHQPINVHLKHIRAMALVKASIRINSMK